MCVPTWFMSTPYRDVTLNQENEPTSQPMSTPNEQEAREVTLGWLKVCPECLKRLGVYATVGDHLEASCLVIETMPSACHKTGGSDKFTTCGSVVSIKVNMHNKHRFQKAVCSLRCMLSKCVCGCTDSETNGQRTDNDLLNCNWLGLQSTNR